MTPMRHILSVVAALVLLPQLAAAQCMMKPTLSFPEGAGWVWESPNGSFIAIPVKGAIKILRSSDLQEVWNFAGFYYPEFLPDGRLGMTRRDSGGEIKAVADLATGQYVASAPTKNGHTYLTLASNGRVGFTTEFIPGSAIGDSRRTIALVTFPDLTVVAEFTQPLSYWAQYDKDARRAFVYATSAASGHGSTRVHVVDTASGRILQRLDHPAVLSEVTVAKSGRYLLTKTDDGVSRLWDVDADTVLETLSGPHQIMLSDVLVRFNATQPATTFDLANGERGVLPGSAGVEQVYAHSADRTAWLRRGNLEIYDRAAGRVLAALPHGLTSHYVSLSRDGRTLLQTARSKENYGHPMVGFTIVDMRDGRIICTRSVEEGALLAWTSFVSARHVAFRSSSTAEIYAVEDQATGQARAKAEIDAVRARSASLAAPDRARAQTFLKQGFELFQAGEFEAAILRFRRGLEIDPANGLGHFYLAETYARQDNKKLAREHYQKTVDFAPDSKEAAIAEARLGQ